MGTLGDPKAIPVVETFSSGDPDDYISHSAKNALKKLRERKEIASEEIVQLRESVDVLKKETEKLKIDFEDLKKQLGAKEQNKEEAEDDKRSDFKGKKEPFLDRLLRFLWPFS